MAVQQISERQVADLVTSLARGRTVAQTATRLHMAESIVDEIGRLNGYPNTTELNRNSRILNRRLRDKAPAEDLDTDVPVTEVVSVESDTESDTATPVAESAASSEVPEPEVEEPDVVLWRCVRRGCGYDLRGPKSADEADVQRAIDLHKQTHRDEGTVAIPGAVHVGHPAGERRLQDCAACRAEAVEPPVIVPGEVVPDESIAAAVDQLIAHGHYDCPVESCDFNLSWAAGPGDDDAAAAYIDQQIAEHEASHRVEVAHVPNGHWRAGVLVSMGGQLAATLDSPGPLSPVEVVPDAADVATSEQHGVRDGEQRTIEQLLDQAEATGHERIAGLASSLRTMIQHLADQLDRWTQFAEEREAILDELRDLGRRQDELTEKLARLDADAATVRPEVIQTPTLLADAKNDLAAAILEDKAAEAPRSGFEVFPKPSRAKRVVPERSVSRAQKMRDSLWGRLTDNVRAQIRPWCEENGVPVSPAGRCAVASIEAYLAAHPEDDPR